MQPEPGQHAEAGEQPQGHLITAGALFDCAHVGREGEAADTAGAKVCLYGHSAGGLIATLFADRLRRDSALAAHRVTGLILNSPFFDLHGPAVLRSAPVSGTLRALARFRKLAVIRQPTEGGYGTSLHRDHGGEFDAPGHGPDHPALGAPAALVPET